MSSQNSQSYIWGKYKNPELISSWKIKRAELIINLINFKAISIAPTNLAQIEIKRGTQFNFPNYEPNADGEWNCWPTYTYEIKYHSYHTLSSSHCPLHEKLTPTDPLLVSCALEMFSLLECWTCSRHLHSIPMLINIFKDTSQS